MAPPRSEWDGYGPKRHLRNKTGRTLSPGALKPGEDYGLDLGYAAGARQALDHLGGILRRGETVRCAATAFLEGRSGLVAATSQRLLFVYRDETPIDTPYAGITRFRAKAGVLSADLEFEDSTGRAVLRQIHPRSRLVDLVGILQGRPGETEVLAAGPAPAARPDREAAGAPAPSREADAAPVPTREAAGAPAINKEAAWTPKLRSKIAPLAPRGPAKFPSATPPAPSSPSSSPSSSGPGWKPQLGPPASGLVTPIGGRPPGRPATGPRERVALPPGGWLGTGEWLVSTFARIEADLEEGRKVSGNAAVTNRRLLLLESSGSVAAEWGLGGIEPERADSPMRVRLSQAVEFGFSSAEGAGEFSQAVVTAGFLARPQPGSGSDG